MRSKVTNSSARAAIGALAVALAMVGMAAIAGPSFASSTSAPRLEVVTRALAFGPQDLGTPSPVQVVAIRNAGSAAIDSFGVYESGADFAVTTTCGAYLSPSASCSASVRFTPTGRGVRTGSISLIGGSPQQHATIELQGGAVTARFPLTTSGTAFDFGEVETGAHADQAVTLTNASDAPVSFTALETGLTGDFSATSDCDGEPEVLQPGASCAVTHRFAPTADAFDPAHAIGHLALAIVGGETRTVDLDLRGTSTSPLRFTAEGLEFGTATIGHDVVRTATLANTSAGPLSFTMAASALVPPFSETDTCAGTPKVLASGATCSFRFTYVPDTDNIENGHQHYTFSLTGSSTVLTEDLYLAGEGIWPLASSGAAPEFGDVALGSAAQQAFTIRNNVDVPVDVTAVATAPDGPFSLAASTCPSGTGTLPVGDSCSYTYEFRPTALGDASSTATVTLSLPGEQASRTSTIGLHGTGVATTAAGFPIRASDTAIDFGLASIGTPTTARAVTLRNVSSASVTFTTSQPTFASLIVGGTCKAGTNTLAPGATCTFTYQHLSPGLNNGENVALTVATGGRQRVFTLSLFSYGVWPIVPAQDGLDFGQVAIGSARTRAFTLVNVTASPVNYQIPTPIYVAQGLTVSGNSCGTGRHTLVAGASCAITYRYAPRVDRDGSYTEGTLVLDDGTAMPWGAGPTAIGRSPLTVSPRRFDFGDQDVGTTQHRTATVTNRTTSAVSIADTTTAPGGAFGVSEACGGTTLGPGASCAVDLTFHPLQRGDQSSTAGIDLLVDGLTLSQHVDLDLAGTGAGPAPALWATPTHLDFGAVGKGGIATHDVILTNAGDLAATDVAFDPSALQGLSLSGTCPTVAPGASCTLHATFEPDGSGGSSHAVRTITSGPASIAITLDGGDPIPPTAADDAGLTPYQTALHHPADGGLLANDAGDGLVASLLLPPSHGQATVGRDGSYDYLPQAGFSGPDSFVYRATDSFGGTAIATVHLTVGTGNAAFIRAAYHDFLDHAPTPTELSATTTSLDAGSRSRTSVLQGLASSDEWVGVIVDHLYEDTLGRAGDPGGRAFWIRQITSGKRSVASASAQFYASNEYYRGFGHGTDGGWIDDLYVKLLGRPADAAGRAYWITKTGARGRPFVAAQFFQSAESRRARVTRLYQDLLHRAPDRAGRDHWAAKLQTVGDIALAVNLAASQEYLTKAQTRFP